MFFRPFSLVVLMVMLVGSCASRGDKKPAIAIAAVGPMTGPAAARGKDEAQAVRMAVDEANAAGGVNGHLIQLDVYDDGDQAGRARETAEKIAGGTQAVAVLGQVASQAAIAAGEVYKARRIPAITGAASQSLVTRDNGWFFRLLPDAVGQGRFLADYARYRFGTHNVIIIREEGTAGEEFASAVRDRAKSRGIRIAADLEFPAEQANNAEALGELAKKMAKLPKDATVVLGAQFADTPLLLRVLHDKVGPFPAMGYSSVATDLLSAPLADAAKAHDDAGFYTDGLTVAAPQLADVAEYAQTVFSSRYKQRYGVEASPEAVRWYEGAELLFQAIAATGISGANRDSDRRLVHDWLAGLNRPQAAVKGVAGPIYFDKDGNVQQSLSVGMFYGGRLISAPVQFLPVTDPLKVPGWDRLKENGLVIDSGETRFVKTPVIYAGIDLNSLDNIDVRASTFAADFFVWFRSLQDFPVDPHEVEFPTVVSGGQLGQEVLRRNHDGFTTVTYHVKGVFHCDYEFSRFPFDRQELKIPIQFRNSTSYSVILAYGGAGNRTPEASTKSPLASKLWKLTNQIFYRDVVAYQSSFGEPDTAGAQSGVQFNRINAQMTIYRDVFGYAVKNFLPLGCILVAVLIGYALAPDVVNPRVSIGVTALLTTSVLYQKMASELPTVTYIIAIDYVFFAFFAFCVLFLALTVVTYETHKAKMPKWTDVLNRSGAAVTMVVLVATFWVVWVHYWGAA
jgi:ABC-type branched-subunit amino acid transport system substrate-binding protein